MGARGDSPRPDPLPASGEREKGSAAWRCRRRSGIDDAWKGNGTPLQRFAPPKIYRKLLAALAAGIVALAAAQPALAADEPDAPKGAAVTVLTAKKSCFSSIVEATGIIIPRQETAVRPERPGLKVSEIMVEAGDTVTSGQALAKLTLPEGGTTQVQAPVAGLVSGSTAVIGAVASGKGEALFSIIARGD